MRRKKYRKDAAHRKQAGTRGGTATGASRHPRHDQVPEGRCRLRGLSRRDIRELPASSLAEIVIATGLSPVGTIEHQRHNAIWATRPLAPGWFRRALRAAPNEKPRPVKAGAFRGGAKRQSGSSCCKGRSRTSMWMEIGAARVASCETVYSVGFFPLLPRVSGSVRAAISCLRGCVQKSLKSNVSLYSQ